jgi:hypothetical protein
MIGIIDENKLAGALHGGAFSIMLQLREQERRKAVS